MTYRTIVVGTDGSATAVRAVAAAADLAAADDARLVIVTAFERHDDAKPDESIPDDVRWMLTDSNEAESYARDGRTLAVDAGVHDVVVQAIEGSPAEKLIETAEDFGADLIVVGSVGLTDAAHFILGSVASTVLHHAPADVLVVHTAD